MKHIASFVVGLIWSSVLLAELPLPYSPCGNPDPFAQKPAEKIGKPKPSHPCVDGCPCDKCGSDCECGAKVCSPACRCVVYEWYRYALDNDGAYLFRNGVQVGAWYDKGFFRPYDAKANVWGPKQKYLPEGVPEPPKKTSAAPSPIGSGGGRGGRSC